MTVTTAVIAVLSLIVAGGGLWLGIANWRHQRRRDFPPVKWEPSWTATSDDDPEFTGIVFKARNIGRGEAMDVYVDGFRMGGVEWKQLRHAESVPFGKTITVRLSARSESTEPGSLRLRMRWREGAALEDVQTKEFSW